MSQLQSGIGAVVVGIARFFLDRQRAHEQRFGFVEPACSLVKPAEAIEAQSKYRTVRAGPFANGQRALAQRLGLQVAAADLHHGCEVVDTGCDLRVEGIARALEDGERALGKFLRLPVAARESVELHEIVEPRGDTDRIPAVVPLVNGDDLCERALGFIVAVEFGIGFAEERKDLDIGSGVLADGSPGALQEARRLGDVLLVFVVVKEPAEPVHLPEERIRILGLRAARASVNAEQQKRQAEHQQDKTSFAGMVVHKAPVSVRPLARPTSVETARASNSLVSIAEQSWSWKRVNRVT